MSVKITYNGNIAVFKSAVKQANEFMASDSFFRMIKERREPFDDSNPKDLAPAIIAEIFRKSRRSFDLREYKRRKTVGGRFHTGYPRSIWGNVNAVGRGACEMACVFVHECVHALSYHSTKYDFSHDKDSPHDNRNTAPYWIQRNLRDDRCPDLRGDKLLEVELVKAGEDEEVEDVTDE